MDRAGIVQRICGHRKHPGTAFAAWGGSDRSVDLSSVLAAESEDGECALSGAGTRVDP